MNAGLPAFQEQAKSCVLLFDSPLFHSLSLFPVPLLRFHFSGVNANGLSKFHTGVIA